MGQNSVSTAPSGMSSGAGGLAVPAGYQQTTQAQTSLAGGANGMYRPISGYFGQENPMPGMHREMPPWLQTIMQYMGQQRGTGTPPPPAPGAPPPTTQQQPRPPGAIGAPVTAPPPAPQGWSPPAAPSGGFQVPGGNLGQYLQSLRGGQNPPGQWVSQNAPAQRTPPLGPNGQPISPAQPTQGGMSWWPWGAQHGYPANR